MGAAVTGAEEVAPDAAATGILQPDRPSESEEAADVGVTVELPKAACSLPGQLGVRKLTKRFGKMVTDVEDPRSRTSGDGETVDQLVPQDLCDIETTVAAFKITKNAAVKLACPNLDDQ